MIEVNPVMWTEAHIHKGLKTELARVSPVKHLKVSKAKKQSRPWMLNY